MKSRVITCEIITTGDELTRGEVINTNAAFISSQLTALGINVTHHYSIRDNKEDLKNVLIKSASQSDYIIVTGGLGPTEDDITVDAVCELLQLAAIYENSHKIRVEEKVKNKDYLEIALRQARIPKGSTPLPNSLGFAPGFKIAINTPHNEHTSLKTPCFFLPGVPLEMKQIFNEFVLPQFKKIKRPSFFQQTYRVVGLTESQISRSLQKLLPESLGLRFRYKIIFPEVLVSLEIPGYTAKTEQMFTAIDRQIKEVLGSTLYATGETSLIQVVAEHLLQLNSSISTAESCTGGLLGAIFTELPGSSRYYRGGVVAYDNKVKQKILNVPEELIEHTGAVSQQCVEEMAQSIRLLTNSDLGIATSGIAGPDGGTDEKPVGTVFIALANKQEVQTLPLQLQGDREKIRHATVAHAINFVREFLVKQLQVKNIESKEIKKPIIDDRQITFEF